MNTTLLPSAPITPFERLNQMMEDLFPATPLLVSRNWLLPVDIKETPTEFVFLAELPAMARENIEVELTGDTLVLRGRREEESSEEKEGWVRKERSYGTFQRSFRLDVPVKPDKISAEYKDGLLKVCVPKVEALIPQKITIKP